MITKGAILADLQVMQHKLTALERDLNIMADDIGKYDPALSCQLRYFANDVKYSHCKLQIIKEQYEN